MQEMELAERAVACKHWRWMPGMLVMDNLRIHRVDSDGNAASYIEKSNYVAWIQRDGIPDLTDPATLGCLLALVRETWGVPQLFVESWIAIDTKRLRWSLQGHIDLRERMSGNRIYDTEAEALVAALEAAP